MSDEATFLDTGAEPVSQTAEDGGTTEEVSESAETQEIPAAESGEETESTESETEETGTEEKEENPDKGTHQKTLEERVLELAEKKAAEKVAEIERLRADKEAAERPTFREIDYTAVNRDMNKSYAREQEILNEIAIDPDEVDPALTNELRAIRIWRQQVETELEANEKAKAEFLKKQQEQRQQSEYWQQQNARIQETIKIIQEKEGASDEVVTAIRNKWSEMAKADPLLQRQFDEGILAGKITETVIWARKLAQAALSEAATKTIEKKESGKEKQIGGESGGESFDFGKINTWKQLMDLPSKQINQFAREHQKRFAEIKRKHFK